MTWKISLFIVGLLCGGIMPVYAIDEGALPNSETCELFNNNFWGPLCKQSIMQPVASPLYSQELFVDALNNWLLASTTPLGEYRAYFTKVFGTPDIQKRLYDELSPCLNGRVYVDPTTSALVYTFCPDCGAGHYAAGDTIKTCQPCPKNTYRTPTDPGGRCTPCPENGVTAAAGSPSLSECYLSPAVELKDALGTFHYSGNCYIK
ncbi:hypothetical protein HDR63_01995 [bacterium]|nr:hypothetical protein [bacterium]